MSDRLRYQVRRLGSHLASLISRAKERKDYTAFFRGKNVVLVGPNCLMAPDDRKRMAAADVVVVMNKGRRMAIYPEVVRTSRRVAYFHCLDTSEVWGGGRLDTEELRQAGFDRLFYPLADARLEENVVRFHRSNRGRLPLWRVDRSIYDDLELRLNGFRPTSGLAIASSLARIEGCELHVCGLTFYRRPYASEYAGHLTDLASIRRQMEGHGLHHPDREFLEFIRLKKEHAVTVDDQLASILAVPYAPLFYTDPGDHRLVPANAVPPMIG